MILISKNVVCFTESGNNNQAFKFNSGNNKPFRKKPSIIIILIVIALIIVLKYYDIL